VHLARLEVSDLRCHVHAAIDLPAGPTMVVGANGVGKTSLVEAVGYLATGASHRVASDGPLVRRGATSAVIDGLVTADVAGNPDQTRLVIEILPGRVNRARRNGSAVRPRDLIGVLRTVLFSPDDCTLVTGEPSARRRFLDDLTRQLLPRQAALLTEYERIVRQRTALLRAIAAGGAADAEEQLPVWDDALVTVGTEVTVQRHALTARLTGPVARWYGTLAGGEGPAIAYLSAVLKEESAAAGDPAAVATAMRGALRRLRQAERVRGACLTGPHRDDVTVTLGGLPARGHASQGEGWSIALALRLAALDLLRDADDSRGDPVLLLDDVFSALDGSRRARLADALTGVEQVLITTAAAEDVPASLRQATRTLTRHGDTAAVA